MEKNWRMRILGGKIRHIRTDVTDQAFFKKWRMRITRARIFFFKFFGGKMFYLKQPLARIELTKFTN